MKYKVLLISGFICWGIPLLAATIVLFAYWQTHAYFLLDIGFLQIVLKNQVKEATITGYASKFGIDDSRIILSKDSEIIIQKFKP